MKYRYKFTIIMSIYKTDLWLREAVDSIINQDIGFEDNIQIIMVNDGSPDRSEEICLEYEEKYPDNILYLKKENGGLPSARNVGLKFREGKYINFFDPDDKLTKNTLSEVYDFYELNNDKDLALVFIPLIYFEAKTGLHPKYEIIGKRNKVFSLDEEPENFVFSSASSFYSTEVFNDLSFPEDNFGSEDMEFNLTLFNQRKNLGYVVENKVGYYYRQRITKDSIMNTYRQNPRSYLCAAKALEAAVDININKGESVPEYLQQSIIYDVKGRIATYEKNLFTDEEYDYLTKTYTKLTSVVSQDVLRHSPFAKNIYTGYVFATRGFTRKVTKINKSGELVTQDDLNTRLSLRPLIKEVTNNRGSLRIDILYHKYNLPITLAFRNTQTGEKLLFKDVKIDIETSHDKKYGVHNLSRTTHAVLSLDKPRQHLGAYDLVAIFNNRVEITVLPYIFMYSPFALNSKKITKPISGVGVKLYDYTLEIVSIKQFQTTIRSNLLTTLAILRRTKKLPLTRLLSSNRKKFIIIGDRPYIARDNGEALFRYINKHVPQIAESTYFVIDKKSSDYKRLRKVGKVVALGSLKHKYLYLNSKLIMSSHLHQGFSSPYYGRDKYRLIADLMERKFIWLQHGVAINEINGASNKFNQGVTGLVVSANPEYKMFSTDKYFYDKDNILLTGIPRLDRKKAKSNKTITVIPTWRNYITGKILDNGLHEKNEEFEQTEFYKRFADILTNALLLEKLKKKGLKIDFILHPGMMNQVDSFKKFESNLVNIVQPENVNYEDIFSRSQLMITDYSSVLFDFSYLYKPTILYQFDRDDFLHEHYEKSSFFDYDRDSPGPVLFEHNQLIDAIIDAINNDFAIKSKYKKRIDNLFIHHDYNNSKRLIRELRERNYL